MAKWWKLPEPKKHPVLDPRVAYVMTTMMEGVVNTGTAFPVRQIGFNSTGGR